MPMGIAVDDTHMYWVNMGTLGNADGTVQKADLSGNSSTTIADVQSDPYNIVVDQVHVFWANWGNGSIMKSCK